MKYFQLIIITKKNNALMQARKSLSYRSVVPNFSCDVEPSYIGFKILRNPIMSYPYLIISDLQICLIIFLLIKLNIENILLVYKYKYNLFWTNFIIIKNMYHIFLVRNLNLIIFANIFNTWSNCSKLYAKFFFDRWKSFKIFFYLSSWKLQENF